MLMRLPTATIRIQLELPLRFADGYTTDARLFSFDGLVDGGEHLAFALGDRTVRHPADDAHVPLIRPHSECLTGDVFGSERCDCGAQLREAVERIAAAGGSRVALLSNNPDKALQLRSCGVTVVEQVPTGVHVSAANHRYLETKARRGGHTLELPNVAALP
jgi:GTP cyclohydrolase II